MKTHTPVRKLNQDDCEDDVNNLMGEETNDSQYAPIVYIHGEMNAEMAGSFIRSVDKYKANHAEMIMLDIASEGGSLFALNQMLSVIDGAEIKFGTYCSSHAFSVAAVLLSAGEPGLRFMSPYGCAMIHSILYATEFQGIEEHNNEAEFNNRLNDRLLTVVAKNMKTTLLRLKKRLTNKGSRNLWLLPEEALELNLVDTIGIPTLAVSPSMNLTAVVVATKNK